MPAATQGSMKTSDGVPLPLQRTDVQARISGPIADVQVTQVFQNNSSEKIEATYSFPLSHEGSVCRFHFKLGDRIIKGVIKEKEEAKKTYEQAKARGQAASLLEQDKENLFTMSVANINPQEIIEVHMGYQEKIPFDDGEYRFIFPLVATESFDNSTGSAPAKDNKPNPTPTHAISASDKRTGTVNVKITVNAGIGIEAPKSLSHSVEVKQENELYHVQLSPTDSLPNRDFVIAYKLLVKDVEPVLYFEKPEVEQPGSLVLVVTPPAEAPASSHTPFDIVFLVDRSFSMRGGSLPQCAKAVSYLLEPLTEQDGVQCGTFDHDMESFDGKAEWRNATPDVKQEITKFLEQTKPRGGTELELALYAALDVLPQRPKREKIICLLTDAALGDLTRSQQLCDLIVKQEHTRLYVLGVGPAVDRFAVQQLAKKANGVSEVLLVSEKDITGTMGRFRRRVLEAGPVIQNLAVDWDKSSGLELFDFFPSSLPDLFTGQPLQMCGRYKGKTDKPVVITITGNNRDGSAFKASKSVTFPTTATKHVGVQRTWAKFKIDALTESLSSAQNQDEAKFDIIALSFQNVLMSKFTSFVAEEEDPKEKAVPITVTREKSEAVIDGLKGSDKAKSILLRAAIALHTPYTGSAIKVGDKTVHFGDDSTLINQLDLSKKVELVNHKYVKPVVESPRKPAIPFSRAAPGGGPARGGGGIGSKLMSLMKSSSSEKVKASAPEKDEKKSVMKKKEKKEVSSEREMKRSSRSEEEEESLPVSASLSMSKLEEADFDDASAPMDFEEEAPVMRSRKSSIEAGPSLSAPPPPAPLSAPSRRLAAPCAPPPPMAPMGDSEAMPKLSRSSSSSYSGGPSSGPSSGTRVLKEVKKQASDSNKNPWKPSKPWLSADKKDFLEKQSTMLPIVLAQPSKEEKPELYSETDKAFVKQKANIGEMDLAFVVDETGSMGSWISQVQAQILNIINSIKGSPLCKDVRVGLVGYRDHPPQDQMVVEVMPLTSDINQISQGVKEMYASGGGDGPECLTDGLYEAVRLNWRPTAAKVVVVITDAPPHGLPSGEHDGFPNGCPCGYHWYSQAACMREMGIVCYTVGCGLHGMTETVYRTIANVTKGLYVKLSGVQLLIPLITGAAETALDRQRLQELLLEVVMENLEELQRIEDDDKLVAELLKRLRAKNVKLRALSVHATTMGMHFEDLTLEDVQLAFDDLRRSERVAL